MIELLGAAKAPEIDYQGLSPVFALAGGTVVVLHGRPAPRAVRPADAGAAAGGGRAAHRRRAHDRQLGGGRQRSRSSRARWPIDTLALFGSLLFYVAGLVTVALSLRDRAPAEAGHGEYYALLLGSIAGMVLLAGAENLVTLFVGLELLSIPLYVLCASEVRRPRLAGVGAQVPGGRLGGVGHAALRPGADLRRHRLHRLLRHRQGHRRHGRRRATRCCSPASRWRPPAWRSRRRWPRSTSGRPTSTRARPPRSRASWPWPPRRRRSPCCCACSTRRCRACRPTGRRPWRRWPRSRSWWATRARSPSARSSGCWPGPAWRRRATCWPAWWWAPRWACRPRSSTWRPTC